MAGEIHSLLSTAVLTVPSMGSSAGLRTQSPRHVVDGEEYHCAGRGNDKAGGVQLGNASYAEQVERPTPDHSPRDPEGDIEGKPFARFVDQLTADEPNDQAEHYPRDDRRSLNSLPRGSSLLNYLVRPEQQRGRNCEAERLGGPEIDDQLESAGLLYWQLGGLHASQNTIDVGSGLTEQSDVVDAVAQ